jgi:hypothetical protein
MLQHHEYTQQTHSVVDQLKNQEYRFDIPTLAGPETLTVKWGQSGTFDGVSKFFLLVNNPAGKEVASLDYSVNQAPGQNVAVVDNKTVIIPYRGKNIAQQMLSLMAKHLESMGVTTVTGRVRKDNTPALVSRQHMREMLTGRTYRTTHQDAQDTVHFYDVTTYLDQFAEEQGEQ